MRISKISNNFKAVYLSNALAPGHQRDYAKEVRNDFIESGLDVKYENSRKDVLIKPGESDDEIKLEFVPYSVERILDDDYSRWNGRLY